MTRFDEVARLRDTAIRAKKVERKKEGNVLSVDAEYAIESYRSSFWLLEVAGCFQPGDAERIARIAKDDLLEGCCSQCDADVDMMHRLQKAAKIMEGME